MKTKQIILDVTLTGRNAVNMEGADGRFAWNSFAKAFNEATGTDGQKISYITDGNCSVAKANYYVKDGKVYRKLKISSDCLRHNTFKSVTNAAIKEDITAMIAYSTSIEGLSRGYLIPLDGGTTAKRKSPMTFTDAEEDGGAISIMENHSSSGYRDNTSLFRRETVGSTHYSFRVFIDLSEMGILSCCDTFDRPCVREECQQLFEASLGKNGIEFEKGAFQKKSDVQPEICYKLSDKSVNDIVNSVVKKITEMFFGSATAYAEFESIKATFVNEDGSREAVGVTDGRLDKTFEVSSQYEPADMDEALKAERLARASVTKAKKGDKKGGKKAETEAN